MRPLLVFALIASASVVLAKDVTPGRSPASARLFGLLLSSSLVGGPKALCLTVGNSSLTVFVAGLIRWSDLPDTNLEVVKPKQQLQPTAEVWENSPNN